MDVHLCCFSGIVIFCVYTVWMYCLSLIFNTFGCGADDFENRIFVFQGIFMMIVGYIWSWNLRNKARFINFFKSLESFPSRSQHFMYPLYLKPFRIATLCTSFIEISRPRIYCWTTKEILKLYALGKTVKRMFNIYWF